MNSINGLMVSEFLGGLGLFFYGVNILADSLQKLAASKIKYILESLTKNTWLATLFGIVMTLTLQSSAASTVMVVEFVNAGLMSLSQGLGVSLGAALGTYILIQLISFPLFSLGLWLIFLGFIPYWGIRNPRLKSVGQCLIGFGCMFVGMTLMSGAFSPLKNLPAVYQLLHQFGAIPLLGILAGIVLTALMQSSSVFLAIMISLSANGLLSIQSIVALVMGAHIGGTLTTLFSSLHAEKIDAKRVAVANSLYRVVVTIILFPFFHKFGEIITLASADLTKQVAYAYLFSTLLMVILFLPLNNVLAKYLVKYIRPQKDNQELKLKYIAQGSLAIPAIALNQANREIRWLGQEILEQMFELIPRLLRTRNPRWIAAMEETERQIDWYYSEITSFLSKIFNEEITKEQILQTQSIQLIAKGWEQIADNLVQIARLVSKINAENIPLQEEDLNLLDNAYFAVSDNYLKLLTALEGRNCEKMQEILSSQDKITRLHSDLKLQIISRVNLEAAGDKSILLDVEDLFYGIGEHLKGIVLLLSPDICPAAVH
jgi:phosphate:Na+ symporter